MADRGEQPRLEIGRVHLRVADLDRAVAFYDRVGFRVALRAGASRVFLTGDGRHHHIVLHGHGDQSATHPMASHFSVRYPHRRALSGVLRRLTDTRVPIDAARDLGTAEAILVADPDGHRIELYCERSPAEYLRTPSGAIQTDARPLDLDSLRTPVESNAGDPAESVELLSPDSAASPPLADLTRSRLRDMRVRLLNLHKVLLDDARAAYELDRGHVRSNANLLHLVINDPWFAWLHPLSELVVRIDEVLQPDAPATESDAGILLEQVARLLAPGGENGRFSERYYEALQRQPAVIVAHAEVRRILKEAR